MTATRMLPEDDLAAWEITEPGVYPGVPEWAYHADPVPWGSLSSTGARQLMTAPAKFRYARDTPTRTMEFGTAAHARTLGAGAELAVITDAAANGAWSTKAAKEAVAAARAAGQVPVKPEQAAQIEAMTARLARHRTAARLFAPGTGQAEVTIVWADPDTGVWRRARIDHLPSGDSGDLFVADYKTGEDASPDAVSRAIGRYRYHWQGAWYRAAVLWARPRVRVRFILVVQEKDPPYLVECYEIDPRDLDYGDTQNRLALERYRDCSQAGTWPGYDPFEGEQGIPVIRAPRWARPDDDDW